MADEIIKVLDDLAARMGVAIDWSAENVLPYVTELGEKLVRFELLESIFWVLAPVVLGIVTYKFTKWATTEQIIETEDVSWNGDSVKVKKEYMPCRDNGVVLVVMILILVLEVVLAINALMFEVETVFAALVFPEKIILEYLQTCL